MPVVAVTLISLSVLQKAEYSMQANLALKKPASQSSTETSAKRAVDGRPFGNVADGSCSATKPKKGTHWWMVDLQGNYLIRYIRIRNRNHKDKSSLNNFNVEITKEKPQTLPGFPRRTSGYLCIHVKEHVPNEGLQEYKCTRPEVGCYVRLIRHYSSERSLVLCEFEVYGDPVPDSTPNPDYVTKSYTENISVPALSLSEQISFLTTENEKDYLPSLPLTQTTRLWRFKFVASKAEDNIMKSTVTLATIISCAQRRIGSAYSITTPPFIQVDFPSGYCRFLQNTIEARNSPSLAWILYDLDIS